MPARYAAFLAIPCRRSPTGVSVLGDAQDGDATRTFLQPFRKLFGGPGCVAGTELDIQFDEFHRREKLRRIFTESSLRGPPGLEQPPYLRDSSQAEKVAVDRARRVVAARFIESRAAGPPGAAALGRDRHVHGAAAPRPAGHRLPREPQQRLAQHAS